MHVQCGGNERAIRADVLDRDMFDSKATTPENTSWTMRLLTQLDKAFPTGVLDRPMFVALTEPTKSAAPNVDVVIALQSGEYDHLFVGAPDRPSDLYRASQVPPPSPDVPCVSRFWLAGGSRGRASRSGSLGNQLVNHATEHK